MSPRVNRNALVYRKIFLKERVVKSPINVGLTDPPSGCTELALKNM